MELSPTAIHVAYRVPLKSMNLAQISPKKRPNSTPFKRPNVVIWECFAITRKHSIIYGESILKFSAVDLPLIKGLVIEHQKLSSFKISNQTMTR